ncbi:hypothetical protein [Actinomadura terrae]|uniref:hypothetical protein n=1 Tax=Actinomadura terrae TaxID=604353 RepID=UPI001FA759FA|nr:hypothetical protein [Actinomadura terrae]
MAATNKRRGFEDLIARRDELADVSPPWTAPEQDPSPTVQATTTSGLSDPASAVPTPRPATGEGELDEQDRADLAVCEAAIDGLRLAFWAAGKALQTIRDRRLYSDDYPSFEAYCAERWEISRRQADRLIAAWPIAEQLRPIGLASLNEGQVRELLPIASQHGPEAAVTVYGTVAETGKVTAAILADVVQQIRDRFDPATAADDIRAYLARDRDVQGDTGPTDPTAAWTVEADRLRTTVRRVVSRPAFRAAARARPEEARAVVAELRALLDELEATALAEDQ